MFVSKKKYELILTRYELAASRADLAERQLAELHSLALKPGGIYTCILACRETAMAVTQPGCESAELTIARLAFVDRRLTDLLSVLIKQMPDAERQIWDDMLISRSAAVVYGPAYPLPEEETL